MKGVPYGRGRRKRTLPEWIDKWANRAWKIWNWKKYHKFLQYVDKKGYDRKDIWYSRKVGFMCMPFAKYFSYPPKGNKEGS